MTSRYIRSSSGRRPRAGGGFIGTVLRGGGMERFRELMDKDPALPAALNESAKSVRERAKAILKGASGSGRAYGARRASAPGQAPVVDTGELMRKISIRRATPRQRRKVARVIARARHAHLLEFGTVAMQPRPFMGPAAKAAKAANFERIKRGGRQGVRNAAAAARARDRV